MYKKVLAKPVKPVRPAMPKPKAMPKPAMGGALGVISPPQSDIGRIMKKVTPKQTARKNAGRTMKKITPVRNAREEMAQRQYAAKTKTPPKTIKKKGYMGAM